MRASSIASTIRSWGASGPGRSAVVHLLLGNGAGQALQFLALFLLTRCFPPESFGELGKVQSIGMIVAIACTLQLHLSIPLCRDEEQAADRVSQVESLVGLVALGLSLICALSGAWSYVGAVALAAALGLNNTYTALMVYRGEFRHVSSVYLLRAIAVVSLQLLFGFGAIRGGLVYAAVAGEIGVAILLRWSLMRGLPLRHLGIERVGKAIWAHRDFAIFGTLQELVSVAAFYAPLILLDWIHSAADAGQYSLAGRLVWAPVVLLSGSLAQVLYHEFGKRLPSRRELLARTLKGPYILLLITGAVVCANAHGLFVTMLGERWEMAAEMIPLQMYWGIAFILSTPCRVACRMMRQQRVQLLVDAFMLVAICALFYYTELPVITKIRYLAFIGIVQNLGITIWVFSLTRPDSARHE